MSWWQWLVLLLVLGYGFLTIETLLNRVVGLLEAIQRRLTDHADPYR